jgi:hypothetical protein
MAATKRIKDYSGRIVRMTAERWKHVIEHSEMNGQERKLRQTLREPQTVRTSRLDPTVHLYYRFFRRSPVGAKYLLAAVKILGQDAFVITAFFTDEIKGGSQVWPK